MSYRKDDIPGLLQVGDAVTYRGETYWIVRGPAISSEGTTFRISRIPPELVVNERDLEPASDARSRYFGERYTIHTNGLAHRRT